MTQMFAPGSRRTSGKRSARTVVLNPLLHTAPSRTDAHDGSCPAAESLRVWSSGPQHSYRDARSVRSIAPSGYCDQWIAFHAIAQDVHIDPVEAMEMYEANPKVGNLEQRPGDDAGGGESLRGWDAAVVAFLTFKKVFRPVRLWRAEALDDVLYAKRFRAMPATPSKPVLSRAMLEGSGVTAEGETPPVAKY